MKWIEKPGIRYTLLLSVLLFVSHFVSNVYVNDDDIARELEVISLPGWQSALPYEHETLVQLAHKWAQPVIDNSAGGEAVKTDPLAGFDQVTLNGTKVALMAIYSQGEPVAVLAALSDTDEKRTVFAQRGTSIGDIMVQSIEFPQVVLQAGTDHATLKLFEPVSNKKEQVESNK